MSTGFKYTFPAIKGLQANREYYVAMCPLGIIPRLFQLSEEELPPEFRAQRILNKSRIPEITKYIVENNKDYVFSSLTASVDGEMEFSAYSSNGLGELTIPMESRFLINDGQHRRAAIEEALKVDPSLRDETISIVFFADKGLKRSQQMFADLNKHAVNTTKSIGILYDNRDPLSQLSKKVVDSVQLLKGYTDKEVDNLSKYSPKIFTLTNLHSSVCCILDKQKGDIDKIEEQFVLEYWKSLCSVMFEWKEVQKKSLSASEFRKNYINAHGVVVVALGLLGNYFYKNGIKDYKKHLKNLNNIDWKRSNLNDWNGRAITNNGRINKNTTSIKLTRNRIKQLLNIELDNEERKIEELLPMHSEEQEDEQ